VGKSSVPHFRAARRFRRRPARRGARCLTGLAIAAIWLAAFWAGAALAAEALPAVQRLTHYPDALSRPIESKLSFGDPAILDWQEHINKKFGQEIRPDPASPDHPLVPRIRAILAGLPPLVHDLASRFVVAVYLLEHDWGTGTAEAVQDAQARWRYGYIALNLSVLERTANAWGTWKERSAFRPEPGAEIRMILASAGDDTVEGALRFIFLHELGHVLGLALGAHGFWDAEPLPAETLESPFVRLSWLPGAEGRFVSRWRGRFPILSRLDFYRFADARLGAGEALAAYQALSQTDFPSLYGAINLYDDWAETFAVYVHTRILGKPYRVEIAAPGGERFIYTSCVAEGHCPEKVAMLERLLQIPEPGR
jgi:hypothetical protein